MKKFLKISGILVILLIATVIILPFLFKDKIIQLVKDQANENLNAKVEFRDVSLSLIKSFPNFSFGLHDLSISGVEAFEGDTLMKAGNIGLTLDLMSVIKGEQFDIRSILLEDIYLHVKVLEDGRANYDIVKSDSTVVEESAETSTSAFHLQLKKYKLSNFNLKYTDLEGDMSANIQQLDHEGKGDFTEEIVQLSTHTEVKGITVIMEGLRMLNRAALKADVGLEYNQLESKLTFAENSIQLNALALAFEGWLINQATGVQMDLKFSAPNTEFKSVLSMVPAVFFEGFEEVKTKGTFNLSGNLNGAYRYEGPVYPAFAIQLNVKDGSFQYPDLPAGIDDIQVDLKVSNPGGQPDQTLIDMKRFHMVMAKNPIDASMYLSTPISDPNFDVKVNALLDLASIKTIMPLEGFDYTGIIQADFTTKGKMSDIDNEAYEKIVAEGGMSAKDLYFSGDSIPMPIDIPLATLRLSPQKADLQAFEMNLGSTDMIASGQINNLIGYALNDELLEGSFNLKSNLLDINELFSAAGMDEESSTAPTDTAAPLEIIRIPQNVDMAVNAEVTKILYSDLELNDLNGKMHIKEGRIEMTGVKMKLLEGGLEMTGVYDSKPEIPTTAMDMKLNNISFKSSYENFGMIQKLAPIMEKTEGMYSTSFSFDAQLQSDMMPNLATVNSKGNLKSAGITSKPDVMKKVAELLKDQKYAQISSGAIDIDYTIKDGRLSVEPFDIKAGGVNAKVSGSSGLDQTIDYIMDTKIPTKGLAGSSLASSLSQYGAQIPENVDVKILIGGTVDDPKVSSSMGDMGNDIVNDLKDQATELVEEKMEEVKEDLNAKAQELIDEAEKQGDALIVEAKNQAAALNAEAKKQGDALRAEAEKQAKKLEADAKGNFLKEAAAKEAAKGIRKAADDNAKKLEKEADNQGKALVAKAEAEKVKLVDTAREKGQIK
jgi:hypothetical protein